MVRTGRSIVRNVSADNLLQSDDVRSRLAQTARSSHDKFSRMHSCSPVNDVSDPLTITIPSGRLAVPEDLPQRRSLPDVSVTAGIPQVLHAEPEKGASRGPDGDRQYITVDDIMVDVPSVVTPLGDVTTLGDVTEGPVKDEQDSGRGSEVTSINTK